MQIYYSCLVDASVKNVNVGREFDPMFGYYVGCPTHRCGGIVAVFRHLVSCSCNYEARCRRYVECVLSVSTCSHNVNIPVAVKNGRYASLQYAVSESKQFFNAHTSHLKTCE